MGSLALDHICDVDVVDVDRGVLHLFVSEEGACEVASLLVSCREEFLECDGAVAFCVESGVLGAVVGKTGADT